MTNYTEADLAEIIVVTLREHRVEPTEDFTAAAGKDYGFVAAYELAGDNGYAIAFGDNAETNYAIAETSDNLGNWLIGQDLSGLDLLRTRAIVFGLGSIEAAAEESANPCVVLISREFYGPHVEIRVAMDSTTQREAIFDSAAAAQRWIDDEDAEAYHLAHNESGRPTYKVVET